MNVDSFGRKIVRVLKIKIYLKYFQNQCLCILWMQQKKKNINKIYVSSDSKYILKQSKSKGCIPINRPKYLCNDKALLEDAIQHAVTFCQKENHNKIENFVFSYVILFA